MQNTQNNTNEFINVRSESCIAQVTEEKNQQEKTLDAALLPVGIIGLLILFGPYILAILNDERLEFVEPLPMPLMLFIGAIEIAMLVLFTKGLNKVREVYNTQKRYCDREVLFACDSRIYGSTMNASFDLPYTQIKEVRVKTRTDVHYSLERIPVFPTELLTIVDIRGKSYDFYSFRNCREIKTFIDMHVRSIANE